MDSNQVADDFADNLGLTREEAERILEHLFQEYARERPTEWRDMEQILDRSSHLQYEHKPLVLSRLQEHAGEMGGTEDPRPRHFFEDYEMSGRYAPTAQGVGEGQPAGTPIIDGSMIHKLGEDYHLHRQGESPFQVWPTEADGQIQYHDGKTRFDAYGQPLYDQEGASPDAGQPQQENLEAWNGFLAEHGPRWNGTEEAWQQFRDWFLYHAHQNQVGQSAEGFLAHAERGDKRQVFSDYGIALPAGDSPEAAGQDPMLRLHRDVYEPVLAMTLAHPEHGQLGEERLRELLAEVIAEHLATHNA